jgi:DNA-binding response OmpR family regulator
MTESGRILFADDEETFLQASCDLLRREGYACDGVPDASTAMQKLAAEQYDLLIADIKMPGNAELEFIQEVPKIAEGLPVILVTGYPSTYTAIKSIQLPVMAYLPKPVDFDELLAQVRKGLKQSRAYRAVRSTRSRMQNWRQELDQLQQTMGTTAGDPATAPVDAFLALTFRNLAGCLTDLKQVTDVLSRKKEMQEVCHLLNCPRPTQLIAAIRETIQILEKTKRAFKSKELGDLRQKLEDLLQPFEENYSDAGFSTGQK